jgi:hypothetical protein
MWNGTKRVDVVCMHIMRVQIDASYTLASLQSHHPTPTSHFASWLDQVKFAFSSWRA